MPTYEIIRVNRYMVQMRRDGNYIEKLIWLFPHPSYTGQITQIALSFSESWIPMTPGQVSGIQVSAYLPYADFADVYSILRSEDPCYFWWYSDDPPGPSLQLSHCMVFTGIEPIGEGPEDLPP